MNKFLNKSLFVIADSNLTRPFYLEYLRAAFSATGKNVYIYNNGIPGARMDMVMNCIEEELAFVQPDYAILSFGGNDLGIWLYDSLKPETPDIISERRLRNESYVNALKTVIEYLRGRGIEPILMTPMCYDENLIERDDIVTEKDNKEKALITDSFFKRATFKKINQGLSVLKELGIKTAESYGVEVWDVFSQTMARVNHGCFMDDGVHYNQAGHKIVAEIMYENMFGENLEYFPVSEKIKELTLAEEAKRAYFFVKYNIVYLSYGKKEGQELIDTVNGFIAEKGYVEGLTPQRASGFFDFVKNPEEKQKQVIKSIDALYGSI